jgi:hypothetical protein
MPRAKRAGRTDFGRAVARAKQQAADAELEKVLTGIAGDPKAGPWAEWAEHLLADRGAGRSPPSPKAKGREK